MLAGARAVLRHPRRSPRPPHADAASSSDEQECTTRRRSKTTPKTRDNRFLSVAPATRHAHDCPRLAPRDRSASRDKSATAQRRSKGKQPKATRSWAERTSGPESDWSQMEEIVFSDSGAEDQPNTKLVEVSEKTKKYPAPREVHSESV